MDSQGDAVGSAAGEVYAAWCRGEAELEHVLDVATSLPAEQVTDVLLADQEQRWRCGESVPVANYVSRFPNVKSSPASVAELLYSELLLRRGLGLDADTETVLAGIEDATALADFRDLMALDDAVESADNDASQPERIGRYQVKDRLGSGGMADVYQALDPRTRRYVAVKLLAPAVFGSDDPESLLTEIRHAAGVDHPAVCPVYDGGILDGRPWIVMKQVAGGKSLADWLDEHRDASKKAVAPEHRLDAVDLVRQVCDGVGAIHTAGLVHRDIKPANILIDANGRPLITDFGLAEARPESRPTPDEDIAGEVREFGARTVSGTWRYMSPEAREGEDSGITGDVYGLGVLLFESLTGAVPSCAGLPPDAANNVCDVQAWVEASQDHVDAELRAIVLRAIDANPKNRFASTVELSQALSAWVDDRRRGRDAWLIDAPHADANDVGFSDGLVDLLRQLVLQPVTLRRRLQRCGIENPDASLRQLRRLQADSPCSERAQYMLQMLLLLFIATPIASAFAFGLTVFASAFDSAEVTANATDAPGSGDAVEADASDDSTGAAASNALTDSNPMQRVPGVLIMTGSAIVCGLLMATFRGIAFGVSWAIAWSTANAFFATLISPVMVGVFRASAGEVAAMRDGIYAGIALGVSGGLCRTIGSSMRMGEAGSQLGSMLMGTVFSAAFGVAFGMIVPLIDSEFFGTEVNQSGMIAGFSAGLAFGGMGMVWLFRLPLYGVECVWQVAMFSIQRWLRIPTLSLSPMFHHELSFLPLPTLTAHILLEFNRRDSRDAGLPMRAVAACRIAPGQRGIARETSARMFASTLGDLAAQQRFAEAAAMLKGLDADAHVPGRNQWIELADAMTGTSGPDAEQNNQRVADLKQSLEAALRDDVSVMSDELLAILPDWQATRR